MEYCQALVDMTSRGNMWYAGQNRDGNENLLSFYFMIESSGACPQGMVDDWQNDRTMFLSYQPYGRQKGVYTASIADTQSA